MKGHLLLVVTSFLFSANVMAQEKRNTDIWSHNFKTCGNVLYNYNQTF